MTSARLVHLEPGETIEPDLSGNVVAIGNFDGVHRGHQVLLGMAGGIAAAEDCDWGLVTFEPHPRTFFRPTEPVFRLTQLPVKQRIVTALGGHFIAAIEFNKALAAMPARQFVEDVLVKGLNVTHVVTGYDFHFGQGRQGSPDVMRELGVELGFGVTVVPQVTDDDGLAPYSSSTIRAKLRQGRVAEAADELGYWWTLIATVVEGDRRGHTIGYPTANFRLDADCELPDGIYAVRVRAPDEENAPVWHGAGYVGDRPTFDTTRRFLEVFLLDFSGDLYGRELAIEFVAFIRGDRKFDGLDALKTQMAKDCREIADILEKAPAGGPGASPVLLFDGVPA